MNASKPSSNKTLTVVIGRLDSNSPSRSRAGTKYRICIEFDDGSVMANLGIKASQAWRSSEKNQLEFRTQIRAKYPDAWIFGEGFSADKPSPPSPLSLGSIWDPSILGYTRDDLEAMEPEEVAQVRVDLINQAADLLGEIVRAFPGAAGNEGLQAASEMAIAVSRVAYQDLGTAN
jgi:hypothetical protein